jgi:cytoskeletal protein CcmA (bactofilin family)
MKLIVSIILSLFLIVVALNKNYSFKEGFASTSPIQITSANIADYIYDVYKADVKALQNLADVAIKLQDGGITVPGTMTVSNQLNVGGIAEITGATKLKSRLDVTGVAEITGATKLKSTLDVTGATNMASTLNVIGDITGKTIKELRDKIAVLEAKTVKLGNDGNITGDITCNGRIIFPRVDCGLQWPEIDGFVWQRFGELWIECRHNCVIHGKHGGRGPSYL